MTARSGRNIYLIHNPQIDYQSMKCPSHQDLPAPPPGLHGWPWEGGSRPLPDARQDGSPWPRISIVTPSYNQAQYLEETIRSILLQGYPDLEYFIIDGNSTDKSVEIIRKYEPWLAGWASEQDHGQSDAINKGFSRCTGDIFNWICSDDLLTPGALETVGNAFASGPEIDAIGGACLLQYDDEPEKNLVHQVDWRSWQDAPCSSVLWQPSVFFKRALVDRDVLVRTDLHYCMDRELWAYLCGRGARWKWLDTTLSVFRFTGGNKSITGGRKVIDEIDKIYRSYINEALPLPVLVRKLWLPWILMRESSRPGRVHSICNLMSRVTSACLLLFYPSSRLRSLQREFHFHGTCALATRQLPKPAYIQT
jgi:glycosyltransferase involved in cell wall biosynthesis